MRAPLNSVLRFLRRHSRGCVVAAGLLAVLIVWSIARANPDERFRAITGRDLPPGVRATAYAAEKTDNLLHTTHYWLLTGSPSALKDVTRGTGFAPALEDARWALPDLHRLFGVSLSRTDVVAGYEWERNHDRWFCIFGDGTTALYAY